MNIATAKRAQIKLHTNGDYELIWNGVVGCFLTRDEFLLLLEDMNNLKDLEITPTSYSLDNEDYSKLQDKREPLSCSRFNWWGHEE